MIARACVATMVGIGLHGALILLWAIVLGAPLIDPTAASFWALATVLHMGGWVIAVKQITHL